MKLAFYPKADWEFSRMLLFDVSVRFPAITLLLLIGILAWFDAGRTMGGRLLAIWTLSITALFLTTMPEALALPAYVHEFFWLLQIPNTTLLWLFGLSLFKDAFKLTPLHWGVLALEFMISPGMRYFEVINYQPGSDALLVLLRLLRLSLLLHLLWVAFSGRENDLIELRRRIRDWVVVGTIAYVLILWAGESVFYWSLRDTTDFSASVHAEPQWLSTLRVGLILPFLIAFCLILLRGPSDIVLTQTGGLPEPKLKTIAPKDRAGYDRLISAIEQDKLYRKQGLSIGELSDYIDLPEHHVRALINKSLGYRNFTEFLNTYRLAEVRTALADPTQSRTPVLTIAMDAGYASFATFNRAFKLSEDMTPSAYRNLCLDLKMKRTPK